MGESQQLSCQENVKSLIVDRPRFSGPAIAARLVIVATIWMLPVCDLPVADLLIGVEVICEVAPSLGTGWNVNVSKVFLVLLDHRKDAVLKLLDSIRIEDNVVEL